MASKVKIDGPRRPPADGQPASKLIILLHGYGADGEDLIGLAPHLARVVPDAVFVSPHAHEACGMNPAGRQWFGISTFAPDERIAGARQAAPVIDAFIDAELARHGLSDRDLALIGFSQGTMMALHVALRRARPIAGVLGYSGALVGADTLSDEVVSRPPVLLVHGDRDEMLPVESLFEAVQGLGAAEVPTEWHISSGVGHSIAQDGLVLGAQFLKRVLAKPA